MTEAAITIERESVRFTGYSFASGYTLGRTVKEMPM